ncbi:MAG: ribonuclease HII [archaeon]
MIGPLIIAGVLIEDTKIDQLRELGVRDSKVLSPRRRDFLQARIKIIVRGFHLVEIQPAQIDEVVLSGRRLRRLNFLEAQAMADVITKLQPDVAYVDSSDVLADRFGQDISSMLPAGIRVVSEHHADSRYPVVAAASILGKVRRDAIIRELAQRYGDLGSGYPSDPKTIRFLEGWYDSHGSFPDFVRKSWKTLERISNRRQRKL